MPKLSIPVLTVSRPLSGQVPEHRFVKHDNTMAGDGENTLGATQHYADNEDTAVHVLGAVPVESGALISEGDLIQSDAQGRAIPKAAGVTVARALSSATAAGQFVQCVLIPN